MAWRSYQRVLAESMHATDRWEMQVASGCTIDTLDHQELFVTLEEAIRRGRMEDPGTRDPIGSERDQDRWSDADPGGRVQ